MSECVCVHACEGGGGYGSLSLSLVCVVCGVWVVCVWGVGGWVGGWVDGWVNTL